MELHIKKNREGFARRIIYVRFYSIVCRKSHCHFQALAVIVEGSKSLKMTVGFTFKVQRSGAELREMGLSAL